MRPQFTERSDVNCKAEFTPHPGKQGETKDMKKEVIHRYINTFLGVGFNSTLIPAYRQAGERFKKTHLQPLTLKTSRVVSVGLIEERKQEIEWKRT